MSTDPITFKVVVVGPFGAGKTTLIQAISETPVVCTDVDATNAAEAAKKSATTVSMDFGVRRVADEEPTIEFFMYGTPGQERFSFMWDILARGMDGYVLLVDTADRESWPTALGQLEHFRNFGDIPHIIGANRAEPDSPVLAELSAFLGADDVPTVACDVTDVESAKSLMIDLLTAVLEHLLAAEETGTTCPVSTTVD